MDESGPESSAAHNDVTNVAVHREAETGVSRHYHSRHPVFNKHPLIITVKCVYASMLMFVPFPGGYRRMVGKNLG